MPWSDYLPAPASPAPMLGAELTCYPYISGFGLAQRIVTLALPSPSDMVRLGFRNRASMDGLAIRLSLTSGARVHGARFSAGVCSSGMCGRLGNAQSVYAMAITMPHFSCPRLMPVPATASGSAVPASTAGGLYLPNSRMVIVLEFARAVSASSTLG
ncbi:hypothetical protein G6F59_015482 [Rhizopus arrhizus]|nr:hypothetical protein G6F59_015482 [Rhizopus arrhizus]